MKMAQRSQVRLVQAFQLFMVSIAHGMKPREAIEKIDEAMDVWSDYQDAHIIEMPDQQDAISAMMGQFQAMMAKMAEGVDRREPVDAEFASPDELCHLEQHAWDEYQQKRTQLDALHESMSPEATGDLEREVIELERHWRSYGTAHLRLRLAQLEPAAPAYSRTSQHQDGPKA